MTARIVKDVVFTFGSLASSFSSLVGPSLFAADPPALDKPPPAKPALVVPPSPMVADSISTLKLPADTTLTGVPERIAARIVAAREFASIPKKDLEKSEKAARAELDEVLRKFDFVSLEKLYELEEKQGKRLGSSRKNVVVFPEDGHRSANYHLARGLNEVTIFVPGLCYSGYSAVSGYAETLLQITGQPVLIVINNENAFTSGDRKPGKVENVVSSLYNGVKASISSDLGAAAEPSVAVLASLMAHLADKGIKVRVITHSQGSLIALNAAEKTKSMPEWPKVRENVTVTSIAPATVRAPDGVRFNYFAHTLDPFTVVGKGANLAKKFWPDSNKRPVWTVNSTFGFRHDFNKCIDKHLGRFLIQDVTQDRFNAYNGQRLAYRVCDGVARGEFKDPVWQKVSSDAAVIGVKNSQFWHNYCETLKQILPDGKLGRYELNQDHRNVIGFPR